MSRVWLLILLPVIIAGILAGGGKQTNKEFGAKPAGNMEQLGNEASFPRIYIDAKGHEVFIEKQPERIAIMFFHLVDRCFCLLSSKL